MPSDYNNNNNNNDNNNRNIREHLSQISFKFEKILENDVREKKTHESVSQF